MCSFFSGFEDRMFAASPRQTSRSVEPSKISTVRLPNFLGDRRCGRFAARPSGPSPAMKAVVKVCRVSCSDTLPTPQQRYRRRDGTLIQPLATSRLLTVAGHLRPTTPQHSGLALHRDSLSPQPSKASLTPRPIDTKLNCHSKFGNHGHKLA